LTPERNARTIDSWAEGIGPKQTEVDKMKIEYTVAGKSFSFEIEADRNTTPRSIYIASLKDYKSHIGGDVKMPRYDDDNDVYSPASVEPKIKITPEMYALPRLEGLTKKEIREMF
jgi:hypothetical protein